MCEIKGVDEKIRLTFTGLASFKNTMHYNSTYIIERIFCCSFPHVCISFPVLLLHVIDLLILFFIFSFIYHLSFHVTVMLIRITFIILYVIDLYSWYVLYMMLFDVLWMILYWMSFYVWCMYWMYVDVIWMMYFIYFILSCYINVLVYVIMLFLFLLILFLCFIWILLFYVLSLCSCYFRCILMLLFNCWDVIIMCCPRAKV